MTVKIKIFHCAECKTQTPVTDLLNGDDCPVCKHFTGGCYFEKDSDSEQEGK